MVRARVRARLGRLLRCAHNTRGLKSVYLDSVEMHTDDIEVLCGRNVRALRSSWRPQDASETQTAAPNADVESSSRHAGGVRGAGADA